MHCSLRPLLSSPRRRIAGSAFALLALVAALPMAATASSAATARAADAPRLGLAEAPAKAEGVIRLATYNVLNLFDERDDPRLSGRTDDMHNSRRGLRAKPTSQLEAVAKAIRELDADVLTLQEIEGYEALVEFNETYLKDMGYEYVTSIDVFQERGIEQAVLSRFPITEARVWPNLDLGGVHPELYGDRPNWYAGEPLLFRRSPLFVRVSVPAQDAEADGNAEAYELCLFVVHHKSGRYNDYWREAESAAVNDLIDQLQEREPEANIAVLGDFNDVPEAEHMRTYIERNDLSYAVERTSESDPRTLTHESDRAIDFILVSPALKPEVVEGSGFVLGTPLRASGADWRTVPAPTGYAADHLPVAVDIVPKDR